MPMTSICPARPTALSCAVRAHARIASLDLGAAAVAPGVVAVLTGADFAADGNCSIPPTYLPQDRGATGAAPSRIVGQPANASDRVGHVGEAVGYVSPRRWCRAQARDAAELEGSDHMENAVTVPHVRTAASAVQSGPDT
jgi:aerobic carbon-monoxide dehydrogenase large subunit